MKKEIVDGVTHYANLYTDDEGNTWNFLIRRGGSMSLYATRPGIGAHFVVYDTLDGHPLNPTAEKVLDRLAEIATGINVLLATVERAQQKNICAHCRQPFRGKDDDSAICAACFFVGHRGNTCDQYCKPSLTPAAQTIL